MFIFVVIITNTTNIASISIEPQTWYLPVMFQLMTQVPCFPMSIKHYPALRGYFIDWLIPIGSMWWWGKESHDSFSGKSSINEHNLGIFHWNVNCQIRSYHCSTKADRRWQYARERDVHCVGAKRCRKSSYGSHWDRLPFNPMWSRWTSYLLSMGISGS